MSKFSNPTRRAWLAAAALGATALTGCIVAPAYPVRGGPGQAYEGAVVPLEPPPLPHEAPGAPPVLGYVWLGGYWNWVGGRHAWVAGRWAPPRVGYAWAPHRWHRQAPGWRLAPGHWRRG